MSYSMQQKGARYALRGFGQDNVACGPGEVFDLTAMMCVQAGSATTPVPAVTPGPFPAAGPLPSQLPPPPKTPPPATQASMTAANGGGISGMLPWVLGGVAVVAAVLIVRSAGES